MTSSHSTGRLVVLAGPSCVGKSPLSKALRQFHPELYDRLQPVVMYNSRAPRPGEADGVDYHFRTRAGIEALRDDDRYVVMEVRGDLQALDMQELRGLLEGGDAFFEGNPMVGGVLLGDGRLQQVRRVSCFLAPLCAEEVRSLRGCEHVVLPELVTDVMRRKLLRRTRRQKGELAQPDLDNIERRAGNAYHELCQAWRYDHVIPNHDGEDSDNWQAFGLPLGDARRAFLSFVALLRGEGAPHAESWPADLLPADDD